MPNHLIKRLLPEQPVVLESITKAKVIVRVISAYKTLLTSYRESKTLKLHLV